MLVADCREPMPVLPSTREEWTRTLAPFAKKHLTDATVEGDTASLMFSFVATDSTNNLPQPLKLRLGPLQSMVSFTRSYQGYRLV